MGGVGSDMRLWARDSARTSVRCYYERGLPGTEPSTEKKHGAGAELDLGRKSEIR
jgi:hypothetical protein